MFEEKVFFQSGGSQVAGIFRTPDSLRPAPVLLICHAYGEAKETYNEMTDFLLARGIASLVFDFHGHGETGGMRYHLHVWEWIQDVKAAIDYLCSRKDVDPHRIAGFGFSSGGTALLEAAIQEPRIKALITLDATTRNSLPFVGQWIVRFLCWLGTIKRTFTGKEIRVPLGFLAALIRFVHASEISLDSIDRLRNGGYFYWALPGGEAAFFVDTIERIGQIRQPTLVMWGEEDQVDPVESAHFLYEALQAEKELIIVNGNGHAGHLEENRHVIFEQSVAWLKRYLPAQ